MQSVAIDNPLYNCTRITIQKKGLGSQKLLDLLCEGLLLGLTYLSEKTVKLLLFLLCYIFEEGHRIPSHTGQEELTEVTLVQLSADHVVLPL